MWSSTGIFEIKREGSGGMGQKGRISRSVKWVDEEGGKIHARMSVILVDCLRRNCPHPRGCSLHITHGPPLHLCAYLCWYSGHFSMQSRDNGARPHAELVACTYTTCSHTVYPEMQSQCTEERLQKKKNIQDTVVCWLFLKKKKLSLVSAT